MIKVIFFTQNRWAFGTVHHGLCKELYKHNIYANVLNYSIPYTNNEFNLLIENNDYFVTQPDSIPDLINYGVPLEKIISIAHAEWDINLANSNNVQAMTDNYNIHNYAVISDKLYDIAKSYEYKKTPKKVKYGIHFDMFYSKPSTSLNVVGYGGGIESYNFSGQEIKRGRLVNQATINAGLQFKPNAIYHFLAMPGYYKSVDALVMSSTEEAGGLPMLEGAAAGKLCIGTPVGYFAKNGLIGGGIQVPLKENLFIDRVTEILNYYKNNSDEYHKKCLDIQEYARYNYDWKYVIDGWIELFN